MIAKYKIVPLKVQERWAEAKDIANRKCRDTEKRANQARLQNFNL